MWNKADWAATQIIVRTLESNVMALLVTCKTANEMRIELYLIYEQRTIQHAHIMQSEFFNFCPDSTENMVKHIANYKGLILRMQNFKIHPENSSLVIKLLSILPDEMRGYDNLGGPNPRTSKLLTTARAKTNTRNAKRVNNQSTQNKDSQKNNSVNNNKMNLWILIVINVMNQGIWNEIIQRRSQMVIVNQISQLMMLIKLCCRSSRYWTWWRSLDCRRKCYGSFDERSGMDLHSWLFFKADSDSN